MFSKPSGASPQGGPGRPGQRRSLPLLAIILFCCLLSVHLAVALYWAATSSRPPKRIEPRGYGNVPGDLEPRLRLVDREIAGLPYAVTTNAQGFRGLAPVSPKRSERTLRILCLGDSFTFGVGVDDRLTYPALLQKILQARHPDRDVEVINAGVPFYDLFDELSYFREKGARLAPDVVVVQFYINDLEAMAGSFFRQDLLARQGGRYNRLDQASGREAVERRLNAWTEKRLGPLAAGLRADAAPAGPLPGQARPFADFHLRATPREKTLLSDRRALLDAASIPAASRLWGNYRRALLAMRDAVAAQGAAFLFIIAPDVGQVREGLDAPAAALAPFCRENGIPVLDLAQAFRPLSRENPDALYLTPLNAHPNGNGNTVMATAVADTLRFAPGPGRPRVAVAPAAAPFDYADPVPLRLTFAKQGVLPVQAGPVSVRTLWAQNLVYWETEVSGNRIRGLKSDLSRGAVGHLVLGLESSRPLARVSLTLFRRLFTPQDGFVSLSWSRDGVRYENLLSMSSQDVAGPEAFETGRFVELDFRDNPASRLYLKIDLRNEAVIFAEDKEPPWRRFEVICYPVAEDEGGADQERSQR